MVNSSIEYSGLLITRTFHRDKHQLRDFFNRHGYLHKWGVDLLPLWTSKGKIEAPPLPQRIDYALRRVGGLRGLNLIDEEKRPFMFRDFCEAYNLAPSAETLAPQFADKFITGETLKRLPSRGTTGL